MSTTYWADLTIQEGPMSPEPYFEISSDPDTANHIRKERDKARALKRSPWWKTQRHKGICHYCGQRFPPDHLSMDHIVPLARGGKSSRGNVVPACPECNRRKKLDTPADTVLRQLSEGNSLDSCPSSKHAPGTLPTTPGFLLSQE
ncbi:MAG: HNH endonuclease [Nitrospira sp.]|nr:HNH endonuclease [Nitrospira sp.]